MVSTVKDTVVWRRNVYVVFVAQIFVMMAFSIVFPFMPFFVQEELGVQDPGRAAFWAGIFSAGMVVGMFLTGPLWGFLADRYGRKPMLLRAQLGGAVTLFLTGFAVNVYQVLALRVVQGAISGSLTAAMALVASQTPREKMGYSMGLLQMAFFMGNTVGPLLGGVLADHIGYRETFFITGGLVLFGALVTLLLVKEKFQRATVTGDGKGFGFSQNLRGLLASKEMLSALLVLFLVQAAPAVLMPVLPLFLKSLAGAGVQVASAAGLALALMGLTGGLFGALAGRLSEHWGLKLILIASCLGSGLFYAPQLFVTTVAASIFFFAMLGSFKGSMATASSALVGAVAPPDRHGAAYGLVQSVNAMSFGVGPLVGGVLADWLGLRPVFLINGVVFIMAGALVAKLVEEPGAATREAVPEAARPSSAP